MAKTDRKNWLQGKTVRSWYSPHCFQAVEQILEGEPAFSKFLGDYTVYPLRSTRRKIPISKFTKGVIFEMGCRGLHAIRCTKTDILRAAIFVKLHWPDVPMTEPLSQSQGRVGTLELLTSLKTAVAVLEKRRRDLDAHIASHYRAITALTKG